jgi:excisionase family DNA binding protein
MNPQTHIEPRLLTAKQLSVYLGLPLSTIYAMVEQKRIPFKRFGAKMIRFDKKDIDEWVDGHYDRNYCVS